MKMNFYVSFKSRTRNDKSEGEYFGRWLKYKVMMGKNLIFKTRDGLVSLHTSCLTSPQWEDEIPCLNNLFSLSLTLFTVARFFSLLLYVFFVIIVVIIISPSDGELLLSPSGNATATQKLLLPLTVSPLRRLNNYQMKFMNVKNIQIEFS